MSQNSDPSDVVPQLISLEFNYINNIVLPLVGVGLAYIIYLRFLMIPLLYWVMIKIHADIETMKKELFEEAIGHIKSRSENQKAEVLEIGVGAGENFRHFPKDSNVHILDKTDEFLPFLKGS